MLNFIHIRRFFLLNFFSTFVFAFSLFVFSAHLVHADEPNVSLPNANCDPANASGCGGAAVAPPPALGSAPSPASGSSGSSAASSGSKKNVASATAPVGLQDPLGARDVRTIIQRIISFLLGLSGALALGAFVYGGILWISSFGNEKRVTAGKEAIIWATLGIVLIFSAYVLVSTLVSGLSGT